MCGEEHVNDLYRASPAGAETREQKLARSTDIGGGYEVLGFPLTDQMAREIGTLDLIALAPALPTRSLIVLSHPLPSHAALQQALALYEFYQARLRECDARLEAHLQTFADKSAGKPLPPKPEQARHSSQEVRLPASAEAGQMTSRSSAY